MWRWAMAALSNTPDSGRTAPCARQTARVLWPISLQSVQRNAAEAPWRSTEADVDHDKPISTEGPGSWMDDAEGLTSGGLALMTTAIRRAAQSCMRDATGRSRSPKLTGLDPLGRWISCPAAASADQLALLTEKGGTLWLVDTATGKRTAVSGVPVVVSPAKAGLAMSCPPRLRRKPPRLSELRRSAARTAPAARRSAMARCSPQRSGAPRIDGLQGDLAAAAQGRGNGHFSHRIAFGPDGSSISRAIGRNDPGPGIWANSARALRLTDEGNQRQVIRGRSRRAGSPPNSGASASQRAGPDLRPRRPAVGARWARRAATRST